MTRTLMTRLSRYLLGLAVVLVAAWIASLKSPYFDRTNVFMIYMLAVVVVAFSLGGGPAVLACLLSVFLFISIQYNIAHVRTQFEFSGQAYAYLFTLSVMLLTAMTISALAGRLRHKARESAEREARTAALYALSAELADSPSEEDVLESARRHLARAFHAEVGVLAAEDWQDMEPGTAPALPFALQIQRDEGGATIRAAAPLRVEGEAGRVLLLITQPQWLSAWEQCKHLEAMVALCAQALERITLRRRVQEKKILIQQESLRNSILSTVSHDLRTPLASIIGASSSLVAESATFSAESRQRLCTVVYEEANHMLHLVENLLDMAKLQGEDFQLAREWGAIEEIAGSAVAVLRRRARSHDVLVEVPQDLPFIRCDSVLIERVVINLLENAVKYSVAGTQVRLVAWAEEDCLLVSVEDEGAGIPEDQRERVFDPFYRLHPCVTGGGIGLTICRRIIEAHGGRIWIEPAPGGGAAVRFTLPLSAAAPEVAVEQV